MFKKMILEYGDVRALAMKIGSFLRKDNLFNEFSPKYIVDCDKYEDDDENSRFRIMMSVGEG